MKKRLVLLVTILVGVWGAAVYFVFFYGKANVQPQVESTGRAFAEYQIQPLRRKLSQEELDRIQQLVALVVERTDLFEPYLLHLDPESITSKMLSSFGKLGDYRFAGYLVGENEKAILLSKVGEGVTPLRIGHMLDGRYLILYVASFGLLMLDVGTGNLLTIR